MKIDAIYEAVLDTLVDVIPDGNAVISDDKGADFGEPVGHLGEVDLAADFGPGTLTYSGIESEPVSWDFDSVRVIQRNGQMVLTGVVSEIQ